MRSRKLGMRAGLDMTPSALVGLLSVVLLGGPLAAPPDDLCAYLSNDDWRTDLELGLRFFADYIAGDVYFIHDIDLNTLFECRFAEDGRAVPWEVKARSWNPAATQTEYEAAGWALSERRVITEEDVACSRMALRRAGDTPGQVRLTVLAGMKSSALQLVDPRFGDEQFTCLNLRTAATAHPTKQGLYSVANSSLDTWPYEPGRIVAGGVPFDLLDPGANDGRGIIVLHGGREPNHVARKWPKIAIVSAA